MKTVKSTKELYQEIAPKVAKTLNIENVMDVPRIEKVVVNVGVGRIVKESEKLKEVFEALTQITGQAPLRTKAKKSIAGFKIREGQEVGMKVTLRGTRMWNFLSRLINASLPRVRDFQGITESSVDQGGNLNIGLRDHTVFPEIVAERVRHIFGMQITVVSTAQSKEDAEVLFRELGFPLQKKEDK